MQHYHDRSLPAIDISAANYTMQDAASPLWENNESYPPTSASLPSHSPPYSASTLHHPRLNELVSSPSGFVAAASPSSLTTEFAPPVQPRDSPSEPSSSLSQDFSPIRAAYGDYVQRPRSRISSSSSSLTPIPSDASSDNDDEEDEEDAEMAAPELPRKKRSIEARETGKLIADGNESKVITAMNTYIKPATTTFIHKLYGILEDPNNISLISYGRTPGSFEVHDIVALSRDVLPKYFKHSNFASFARQLNMWGWRKESRFGGWIFIHPIFRAGRPDLLTQIKRSDEAGKKRPEGVAARKRSRPPPKTTRPLAPPLAPSRGHPSLSLDTSRRAFTSKFSPAQHQSHPHSAPPTTGPSRRLPRSLHVHSSADNLLGPSPPSPPLISPLFNPDGTHSRPILPPSFLDAPRPSLRPPIFRGADAKQRRLSFESAPDTLRLEEMKKRLAMTTSLLEHVLDRLGVDENHEKFRSFPFYVFDPRFQDPTSSMQDIIAEYDARKVARSIPLNPPVPLASTSGATDLHHVPPTDYHASSFPSPALFPSAQQRSRASTAPHLPYHFGNTSNNDPRNENFGSDLTTISPEGENLVGLGISLEDEQHGSTPYPRFERSREASFSRPPLRRPSTAPTIERHDTPTLGPSSFSLVDFSIDSHPPTPSSSAFAHSVRRDV
ncbi:heat shock factor family protein [Sporobolomyces salmoneus]|uniref:heat shock factor family protein n=1 Tax=Sporobolomyces salmoneus TaxID=183962 RepID=UPI00316E8756